VEQRDQDDCSLSAKPHHGALCADRFIKLAIGECILERKCTAARERD
jgi:hypothetical protein